MTTGKCLICGCRIGNYDSRYFDLEDANRMVCAYPTNGEDLFIPGSLMRSNVKPIFCMTEELKAKFKGYWSDG